MYKDSFKLAFANLKNRKVRTYLTMIGIVIGVTALIALMTLGDGLKNGIEEQFDRMGTRRIFIGPQSFIGGSGPPSGVGGLTEDDLKTVEKISQVDYAAAIFLQVI